MNDLQIFNNCEFGEIRTIEIDGEPWFVGKDIADALGYQNGSRDIDRHVDSEDRQLSSISDGSQTRNVIVINESGIYALVFGSKLESARRFKRWITSEVLPQIRKTGAYAPKSQIEILQMSINQLVEQEKRLNSFENRLDAIEAKSITTPAEYYTIAGFANIRKVRVDMNRAVLLGRKASKLSREYGYEIGKTTDPRFGTVNTYHSDILNEVFK